MGLISILFLVSLANGLSVGSSLKLTDFTDFLFFFPSILCTFVLIFIISLILFIFLIHTSFCFLRYKLK